MNQETTALPATREARYATAATTEIPRATCGRCEDWTTVVIKNVEIPCPKCRLAEHEAWLAAGNQVPRA